MFVSANAVQHFFAAAPPGMGWPAGVLAGSTGPGHVGGAACGGRARAAAGGAGRRRAAFDSEALWARLSGRHWAGRSVLVVRGEDGRDWLAETLRERGAAVDFVAAYRRAAPAARPSPSRPCCAVAGRPAGPPVALQQQRGGGQPARSWRRQPTGRAAPRWPRIRASRRPQRQRASVASISWHLVPPRWLRSPPRGRAGSRR